MIADGYFRITYEALLTFVMGKSDLSVLYFSQGPFLTSMINYNVIMINYSSFQVCKAEENDPCSGELDAWRLLMCV